MSDFPPFLEPNFVDCGGFQIAFGDVGPRDSQVVFLVHGLAASGLQFVADAYYFADQGYRVIVPDLRGHGRSGCPSRKRWQDFGTADMASDILAIADHLNIDQFHYVGNSLGGILALSLLDEHGARFKSFASFGTTYALKTPKVGVGFAKWFYKLLGANLVGRLGAKGTTKDKSVRPLIQTMLSAIDIDVVGHIVTHVGNYDLIENAKGYKGPILMLRGGFDKSVNAALGSTLAAMKEQENFILIEVPKGGHCANLDATDFVRSALLDFWQKQY